MQSIRLKNVRSLADTGEITLRPITLLLGQNSSGKSSLLRSLPLIAQSIGTASTSPILWYGDHVDFGSIQDVKSKFNDDKTVTFEVKTQITSDDSFYIYGRAIAGVGESVWLYLNLSDDDGATQLTSFGVRTKSDDLFIEIDRRGAPTSVVLNGKDYTELFPADRCRFVSSEFVPQITLRASLRPAVGTYYDPRGSKLQSAQSKIMEIIRGNVHGSTSDEKVSEIAGYVKYSTGTAFLVDVRQKFSGLVSFERWIDSLIQYPDDGYARMLRELSLLSNIQEFLRALQRRLTRVANTVTYMGPTRATGERYYRIQELAVDRIDPQGRNLAMFLHSLGLSKQNEFSAWLSDAIGYDVRVSRSSGHVQIELRQVGSSKFFNMADMGYGFSQVLPIMAQIWSRNLRRGAQRGHLEATVAIEQPELHLHPAYQAKLADVFVRSVGKKEDQSSRLSLTFLIETHSEALVNRLGEMIFDKQLDPEDVAIYVFQKDYLGSSTAVVESGFDAEGRLKNWPIGFFSAH